MAIKVNGDIVINDDRSLINVNSIQFGDASIQTTAASPATAGLEVIYNRGELIHTLDNPNAFSTSAEDRFGYSVAISGNYAIVCAWIEDDAGGSSSGKAYIFDVTTGALLHTLDNPNAHGTSTLDYFGSSVTISDKYAIVGAYREEDATGGDESGKAYIFDVTTGALLHTLDNPNAYSTSPYDNFGRSVALDGNYAIVGAYSEDDTGAGSDGSSSGKAYIFNVITGALVYTLDNPNPYGTSQSDWFGFSVAISGNYAVVSAYQEDEAGASASGKAYIFDVTTGTLLHTLNNPNAYSVATTDNFGQSVAISGNYAIVGAYQEDDSGGANSGKAYIFNVTTGALLYTLDNPNAYSTSNNDNFGWSVAIDGNYAIVGAQYEDESGGSASGKAYIYNVTTGTLVYTINNPNAYSTPNDDQFGWSVAISGNYAIVGAFREDDASDASGANSGKAYIFAVNDIQRMKNVSEYMLADGRSIKSTNKLLQKYAREKELINTFFSYVAPDFSNSGRRIASSNHYTIIGAYSHNIAYILNNITGKLIHTLNNPNAYSTVTEDQFGWSVAIDGNYAVVGAYTEDDASGANSGKVYIFDVLTGILLRTLNNPNAYSTATEDRFGNSVAISGNYAIVGAYQEDDDSGGTGGTTSGKAYIFDVTTGVLVHTLNNPNAYVDVSGFGDQFGQSVAMSGNYAIVGAPWEDDAPNNASGKAYIFNVTTGTLVHTLNNPNPYSTSASDHFGWSVAISGNYAIVSALSEDDAPNNDSGKAYIFNVTTGALLHTLNNPNAYSTSDNYWFGSTVAISGNYAVVSADIEGDAGGTASGKVYIFDVTTGALLYGLSNPNPYSTSANDRFGNSVAISNNTVTTYSYGEKYIPVYTFALKDLTYIDVLLELVS